MNKCVSRELFDLSRFFPRDEERLCNQKTSEENYFVLTMHDFVLETTFAS